MSDIVLYRSELLFFVQNNAACETDDDLIATLMFYEEEELVAAKSALFAVAATTDFPTQELPRLRVRRGDKKRESDAGDILELWRMLDQAKVELPLFVAADQKRIPPVTVPGSDLSVMSVSMIEMKTQLKQMATAQKQLVDVVASMQQKMQSLPEQVSARVSSAAEYPSLGRLSEPDVTAPLQLPVPQVSASDSANPPNASLSVSTANNSWAGLVEAVAAAGGIQMPVRVPAKPAPPKIITGKKDVSTADNGPKGVPRRLTAFVGRLHKDTTEDSLKDFLLGAGLINPYCKKLTAKDGRQFRTAAFMVSCDSCCKTLFHDESTWPEGCELRDWVFYKHPATA
jgi:hypothetical protein